MQKTAIRYLRYSKDGQSNSSIEWQDTNTANWCKQNNVSITDTFTDAGYSARTFDRPDFEKLIKFVHKYHKRVNYLVVDQFNRFSRDAGEAISMIKNLQLQFSIQIVSVMENLEYDYHMPGSHFRSGLQFLLAEDDNIMRTNKIRAGIYTAKATEGRFIGSKAPFGYQLSGTGKNRHLVVDKEQAEVIKYIFDAFQFNVPIKTIAERAAEMGFKRAGHSAIQNILANPIYSGQQQVNAWKQYPGGLFPAKHEPIIDRFTWKKVQHLLKPKNREYFTMNPEFPLRGFVYCHCGRLLTAANSRGKLGKLYGYYKCNTSSTHNNVSARRMHDQMHEIMKLISLPPKMVDKIKRETSRLLKQHLKVSDRDAREAKKKIEEVEQNLLSLEQKWIRNQVEFETYQRWFSTYTQERAHYEAVIASAQYDAKQFNTLLNLEIEQLTNLAEAFASFTPEQKQEVLQLVFDKGLYYSGDRYRTPEINGLFIHNIHILKQKSLLEVDNEEQYAGELPAGGAGGNPIELFQRIIPLLKSVRVA